MLPNFIIGGAPKSGTTSLFRWLSDHPEVCPSNEKEIFLLVDSSSWMYKPDFNYDKDGLDVYKNYFKHYKNEKIIMEATSMYLYQNCALRVIPEMSSKPKVLFLLREPASRIYSNYKYFKNNKAVLEDISFPEYIEKIKNGENFNGNEQLALAIEHCKYIDYLNKWKQAVPENRLYIGLFEDMVLNPKEFILKVCDWLEIDPAFYRKYSFGNENRSYQVKNMQLHKLLRQMGQVFPQNIIRESLKNIYLSINTKKIGENNTIDKELLTVLRNDFIDANSLLSREFDLNLEERGWTC